MVLFCTNCGNSVGLEDKFCSLCGHKIIENSTSNYSKNKNNISKKIPSFTREELDLSINSKIKFLELLDEVFEKIKLYRDDPNIDGLGRVTRPTGYLNALKKSIEELYGLIETISVKDTLDKESYTTIARNIENFVLENIHVHGLKTINNYRVIDNFIRSDLMFFPTLQRSDPFSYNNDKSKMPGKSDFFDDLRVALEINETNIELDDTVENRNEYNQYVDYLIYSIEVSKMDLLFSLVNSAFSEMAQRESIYNTDRTPYEIIERWEGMGLDCSECNSSFTDYYPIITEFVKPIIINSKNLNNYEINPNNLNVVSIGELNLTEFINETIKETNKVFEYNDLHYCIYWADGKISGFFLSKNHINENIIHSELVIKQVENYPIAIEFKGELQHFDSGETDDYHEIDADVCKINDFDLGEIIQEEYK